MERKPQELKFGDPCPVNGLPFVAAPVLTEEEYARLGDRETPLVVGRFHDTAPRAFREEHGALYFEPHSGYKTRFPLKDVEAAAKKAASRRSDKTD